MTDDSLHLSYWRLYTLSIHTSTSPWPAMIGRWRWTLRVLRVFFLVPFTITQEDSIVRSRYANTAFIMWIILYCFGICTAIPTSLNLDKGACFLEMRDNTFKTYNIKFVISVYTISVFISNIFCFIRLYVTKLEAVAIQSLDLYTKINVNSKYIPSKLETHVKVLMYYIFVFSFLNCAALFLYCARNLKITQLDFWYMITIEYLKTLFPMAGAVMAVMFFMLLDTSKESFELICKHVDDLTAQLKPEQFLVGTSNNSSNDSNRQMVTSRDLFSLRMLHDELILFMEVVMKRFQTDILIFFLATFYQNIVHNYSVVYTGINLFDSKHTVVFVWYNLQRSVYLVVNLWFVCAGPSRVQEQQRELMSSVSRLSTVTALPTDVLYEMRIFHLQARNHMTSFEVFGMFKLNFSLLFTMCASIVSYIVVLIQFAIDPDISVATSTVQIINTTGYKNVTDYSNSTSY